MLKNSTDGGQLKLSMANEEGAVPPSGVSLNGNFQGSSHTERHAYKSKHIAHILLNYINQVHQVVSNKSRGFHGDHPKSQ